MANSALDFRGVKEIHIMPYSHHDFAWTNTREWHIRRYLQSFGDMLDIMRENKEFTWMIDNVAHSLSPFIRHCPEKIEEMKRRVQEGRIYIANGGASLVRSTYVGEETFIRNMVEGKRFFQKLFGIESIDFYYNADVGCGHSQLPQILQLGGHRYYRFQRPEQALDYKKVPRQFHWEGLDGTRIVVSRGTYGGFMDGRFTNKDFAAEWEEAKREFYDLELVDKIDSLLQADIVWLNYGCDDYLPLRNLYDEPINILGFVEEWNKREDVKLIFSNPGAYFDRLRTDALPVFTGVLDPCELSYNAPFRGSHSMWRMRGELDRLIVRAESLAAFAALTGTEYPYRQLESLWSRLFEITGHAIEFVYRDDFNELYSIASGAKSEAGALVKRLSEDIAGKLQTAEGSQYAACNVLNWDRKEIVKLHITSSYGLGGFDLLDSAGNKLDYQIVNLCSGDKRYSNCEYNEVDVVAELNVPAMGYTSVRAVRNGGLLEEKVKADYIAPLNRPSAPDRVVLNNGVLELVLKKGRIAEIKEAATGRTIRSDRPNAANGLKFVQTPSSAYWVSFWETTAEFGMEPEKWELVENGPLRWVYRVSGTVGASRFSQDIVLNKSERAVSFDLTLDAAGDEGYFAVDFPAEPDTYLYADIPFGVEARELAGEGYGNIPGSTINYNEFERAQKGQFYARSWALFQSGELPAAIVSENCSIYYTHDTENHAVSLILNRSMPLEVKQEGWLLQTHRNINGKGVHGYKFSMYFPEEKERFAEIARFSKGKAQPIETVVKYNGVSEYGLPLERSFVKSDCPNVVATAFYKENDKYVLRLYESEGQSSTVNIALSFPVHRACAADLLGNEAELAPVSYDKDSGVISLSVKPWQIVTLQLEA